jgi:polar amino acid transport system ATP-binding protein
MRSRTGGSNTQADDLTASLDPELVGEVLSMIRDLVQQEGMTALIAAHEMGFARETADRIVVFDNGEIIETGAPELIFTAPKNARTRIFLNRIRERFQA